MWAAWGGASQEKGRPLFLREPSGGVCSVNGALTLPLGPVSVPAAALGLHCFPKQSPQLMVFVIPVIFSRRPLSKNRLVLHSNVGEIVLPELVTFS